MYLLINLSTLYQQAQIGNPARSNEDMGYKKETCGARVTIKDLIIFMFHANIDLKTWGLTWKRKKCCLSAREIPSEVKWPTPY